MKSSESSESTLQPCQGKPVKGSAAHVIIMAAARQSVKATMTNKFNSIQIITLEGF